MSKGWYICKNEILIHHRGIMKQILIAGPMAKEHAELQAIFLSKTKSPLEHYMILEYVYLK